MEKVTKVKKKKANENRIYSPLRITEALKEMGESYTRKEAALYYGALLLVAFLLGLMFELKPLYLVIVLGVYFLFVPQFIYNQKKQAFELRRFNDVNAYMSQMAQSFTSTKSILDSLYETGDTFSDGRMHDTIQEAIKIIEFGGIDIKETEKEALAFIEKKYGCEKLKNLHEFLYMAEERGGDCETEFSILEKVRMAWETAVSDYRNTLVLNRNMSTGIYGFLLGICIFIMYAFSENMSIIHMEMIQLIDTIMLVLFIVFFIIMDKRINKSLLTDAKVMSKEDVDIYFSHMKGVYSEKERKNYVLYPILAAIIAVLFYIKNPTPLVLAFGIIIFLVACNMPKIVLTTSVAALKNEIMKAFPRWLFDVMLLMQRQSVDSAIIKSTDNASPVLQAELTRISNILLRNSLTEEEIEKDDESLVADAYMSFLADFNILQIETSMRKLYSLSVGTGGNGDVMKFIISSNMQLLTDAEKKSIEMKGDASSLTQYLPTFIISFAMIGYCLALMIVAFGQIYELLQ